MKKIEKLKEIKKQIKITNVWFIIMFVSSFISFFMCLFTIKYLPLLIFCSMLSILYNSKCNYWRTKEYQKENYLKLMGEKYLRGLKK